MQKEWGSSGEEASCTFGEKGSCNHREKQGDWSVAGGSATFWQWGPWSWLRAQPWHSHETTESWHNHGTTLRRQTRRSEVVLHAQIRAARRHSGDGNGGRKKMMALWQWWWWLTMETRTGHVFFFLFFFFFFCSILLSFGWGFDLCGVRILDDDG